MMLIDAAFAGGDAERDPLVRGLDHHQRRAHEVRRSLFGLTKLLPPGSCSRQSCRIRTGNPGCYFLHSRLNEILQSEDWVTINAALMRSEKADTDPKHHTLNPEPQTRDLKYETLNLKPQILNSKPCEDLFPDEPRSNVQAYITYKKTHFSKTLP